jgi:hypothetical protein
MKEVTNDYNQLQIVDDTDTDETVIGYSEREEI